MAIVTAQAHCKPPLQLPTLEEYKAGNTHRRKMINIERRKLGLRPYHALKGQPSPKRGQPSPIKGIKRGPNGTKGMKKPWLRGEKPQRWVTGPDPELHKMYIPFLKQKAQAQFRGELWELTFDQWVAIWAGRFDQRGRAVDDLCMMQDDPEGGWTETNAIVVTRREQLFRQGKNIVARRQALKNGK